MIQVLIFVLIGLVMGISLTFIFARKNKEQENKMTRYFYLLNKWLDVKLCGLDLFLFFQKRNYYKIGIYGMDEIGWRLYYELKDCGFEIHLLDKYAGWHYEAEERVSDPREKMPNVDVLVITTLFYDKSIKSELSKIASCPIISIDMVVDDIYSGKYPRKVKNKHQFRLLSR